MRLADWLSGQGMRRSEFARRIGVTPSHITGLCAGTNWPGREVVEAIVRETAGAVTADDFLREASSNAPVRTGLSLDGWMRERGVEDEELARAAECSRSTISRLRRGKQCASPALAERIAAISGGAVAAERLTGAPATRERAA